jgi:hypothetical protein
MPYLAIKTNIADSLNVVLQIERRPGKRFLWEVSEIRGYDLFTDQYEGLQLERSQLSTPGDRHLAKLSLISEEMCTDPRKSAQAPGGVPPAAPQSPFRHSAKGAKQ